MEHSGIDVHEVESQIRILTESGEIVERRIRTERERFAAVLGGRAPAKIVSEASTETESVGRCLEKLGHEVGGRPELRRDVRDAEPQGEDGSARRVRADENQVHDARSCSTPWHAPHDGHRAYPMVGITDRGVSWVQPPRKSFGQRQPGLLVLGAGRLAAPNGARHEARSLTQPVADGVRRRAAAQGSSLPGLRIPFGSNARISARTASTPPAPSSCAMRGAFERPTP